jgi:hypothetical protein
MGCEEDMVSEDSRITVGYLLKALVQDKTSERCSAEWSIVTVLLRKFVIRDRWLKGKSATLLW